MENQYKAFILWILPLLLLTACTGGIDMAKGLGLKKDKMSDYVTKQNGTEPAFQNEYWDEKRPGIYVDINTGEPLFSSLDKFDSGTGWPSFTRTIQEASIIEKEEEGMFGGRTEVRTNASHLGHVFDDGPNGLPRYCINSAALRFVPFEELDRQGYGEFKKLFHFENATFAGGCFWGIEELFQDVDGVVAAISGYAGGSVKNPSYEQVSSGDTGHAESVQVIYDPKVISYKELLDYFWRMRDPTTENRQGWDIGTQYRSVIFYNSEEQRQIAEQSKKDFDAKKVFKKPAVTQIVKLGEFYPAEEYHQNYYDNHPTLVCHSLREE